MQLELQGEGAWLHLSLCFELSLLHDSLDVYQMESDLSHAQGEAASAEPIFFLSKYWH